MNYTINRTFPAETIDAIESRLRKALASEGFGILTEIDIQSTMKIKLGADMPAYRILGACNPKLAFDAIAIEPRVGAMLPCNVIVREIEGAIEIGAIDPAASMQAIENRALHALAGDVRAKLAAAIAAV